AEARERAVDRLDHVRNLRRRQAVVADIGGDDVRCHAQHLLIGNAFCFLAAHLAPSRTHTAAAFVSRLGATRGSFLFSEAPVYSTETDSIMPQMCQLHTKH